MITMQKTRTKTIILTALTVLAVVGTAVGLILVVKKNIYKQNNMTKNPPQLENKIGYELLGGASSICLDVPFLVNGKDFGYRIGTQLGVYKDGLIPQYGENKEAEVTVDSDGVIKVKFHPTTFYKAQDAGKDGSYWLYVGLVYPYYLKSGNYNFAGCGYDGLKDLPNLPSGARFKGEFKWISGESKPPFNSGFGNTLLGGHMAYNFPGGPREIVAFNNFGTPSGDPNPKYLNDASFECSDWWHNLSWSDWYDPKKTDQWQKFDIDVASVNQQAIKKSQKCWRRRNLADADNTKIMGLFVGPEYGITSGGSSVFELKNLRIETK